MVEECVVCRSCAGYCGALSPPHHLQLKVVDPAKPNHTKPKPNQTMSNQTTPYKIKANQNIQKPTPFQYHTYQTKPKHSKPKPNQNILNPTVQSQPDQTNINLGEHLYRTFNYWKTYKKNFSEPHQISQIPLSLSNHANK